MSGSEPRRLDFRLLAGAIGLSALGDFLALIPLALHLEETTGSGILVALLFVAIWSPAILLAGPAGLLADRLDTRRLLLGVSLGQAAVSVALAFVGGVVPVLALALLLGAGFALAQPAEFALIPAIVGARRIEAANGQIETARYFGFTLGPLAGGVLAATGGMRLAMLVNAATFLAVAGVAAVVRARPRVVEPKEPDSAPERARDGAVFLVREPTLAVVMVVAFVSLLFMTASAAAEVFFAKDFLDAGDAGYGALIAAWTLGMTLGALVVARRVAVQALATAALVAIVVQGAGLALPTLWLVFSFATAAYFVGGLAHGTKNVLVRSLIHRRVPERLHGRAFAAYNALRNGAELVALLGGGLLVAAIGARWTLGLSGGIPMLAVLFAIAIAWRRLAEPA
ncbi:MAG: MFS transporter, partial [Gaiellaceae bacterium]